MGVYVHIPFAHKNAITVISTGSCQQGGFTSLVGSYLVSLRQKPSITGIGGKTGTLSHSL